MDIVFSTDNNYFQHFLISVCSIVENNKNEPITFHLIIEDITENNKNILSKFLKNYKNTKINYYSISNFDLSDFPIGKKNQPNTYVSLATYYRLFLTKILPDSINKVLYLDCDIIVRNNLISLWNTNIENYAIGAAKDISTEDEQIYSRLNYSSKCGYFNAGVLLINLDFWRKHNALDLFFNFVSNNSEKIVCHDQDVINAVFHDNIIQIPYTYNYQKSFMEKNINMTKQDIALIEEIEDNPCIIHFTSFMKPWIKECNHPYKKIYLYYKNKTVFKNTKLKSILTKKQKIKLLLSKFGLTSSPIITKDYKKQFLPLEK